jgi:hypothetical protein
VGEKSTEPQPQGTGVGVSANGERGDCRRSGPLRCFLRPAQSRTLRLHDNLQLSNLRPLE